MARKSTQWERNTHAIGRVLYDQGIVKRSQLLPPHFDKHTNFVDIYNLGPILGPQLRRMLDEYGPFEWEAAFPGVTYDSPYHVMETPGGQRVAIVDSGETPVGDDSPVDPSADWG